jgi:hypothetical protein
LWDAANFQYPELMKWKFEKIEINGQSLIQLSRYDANPGKPQTRLPESLYLLDPLKGYEVVSHEGRLMNGHLLEKQETVLADIGGHCSLWYPARIVDKYYSPGVLDPEKNGVAPTWVMETTVENVTVNPQLTKSNFSFAALGYPNGQSFVEFDGEGNRHSMRWLGDGTMALEGSDSSKARAGADNNPAMQAVSGRGQDGSNAGSSGRLTIWSVALLLTGVFLVFIGAYRFGRPANR